MGENRTMTTVDTTTQFMLLTTNSQIDELRSMLLTTIERDLSERLVNSVEEELKTPLIMAGCYNEDVSIARLLLQEGADGYATDQEGCSVLWRSCQVCNADLVHLLLQLQCCDINEANQLGWTPLHQAVLIGSEALVRELLQMPGIRPLQEDQFGRTPLFYAKVYGRSSIASMIEMRITWLEDSWTL
eukprot:scaffold2180_cov194-Ochromonas_danica.AAC.2